MRTLDDRAGDALAAYVASLVDATETSPPKNDVDTDISGIAEHFLILVRAQRKKRAIVDLGFTDIYYRMLSLPQQHRDDGQVRAFGVQYSHETRFDWMKEDIAETTVLIHVYQRIRQDYMDAKSLLDASVVYPPATRPTQEHMAQMEVLMNNAQTQLVRALDTLTQSTSSLQETVKTDVFWGDANTPPPPL